MVGHAFFFFFLCVCVCVCLCEGVWSGQNMMDNHETFLINGVMKREVEGGKMEGGDVFVNM